MRLALTEEMPIALKEEMHTGLALTEEMCVHSINTFRNTNRR